MNATDNFILYDSNLKQSNNSNNNANKIDNKKMESLIIL
jgi:hypothetical protein